MIIHGRCCTFDYSRRVDRANFAGTVVPYFDRMAPKVFAAVGFTLPSQRAEISFSSISGGCSKPQIYSKSAITFATTILVACTLRRISGAELKRR